MALITHPKLHTLHPEWSRFLGYSLLLEGWCDMPPAPGDRAEGGAMVTDLPETLAAHRAISAALAEVGAARLMNAQLLCLLPEASYHVTLADLVHDGNLRQLRDSPPGRARAMAEAVAASADSDDCPAVLGQAGLVAGTALHQPIRMVSAGFECRDNRVAVLSMAPEGPEDARAFDRLIAWRVQRLRALEAETGLAPRPWHPHLSLGYFANPGLVDPAAPELAALDAALERHLRGHVFAFNSVALYGFSSMAAYRRTGR